MNLEKLTVKELREICKEYNIKGYYKMTKAEIVKRIASAERDKELREAKAAGRRQAKAKEKERKAEAAIENKKEPIEIVQTVKEISMFEMDMQEAVKEAATVLSSGYVKGGDTVTVEEESAKRESYRENMKEGMIVAVRLKDGKVKSAKVTKNNTETKRVQVETKLGTIFQVDYDNVLWVKTSNRFPSFIYNQLKGKTTNERVNTTTE